MSTSTVGAQPLRKLNTNGTPATVHALSGEQLEEARSHPERVEVMLNGRPLSFLLTLDGLERAAAATGQDPMQALGRIIAAVFAGAGSFDKPTPEAVGRALTGAVSMGLINDLALFVYAGLVSFPEAPDLGGLKRALGFGGLVQVARQVYERAAAFVGDMGLAPGGAEGEGGGADPKA